MEKWRRTFPAIVIDTREQRPYEFAGVESIRGTLEQGDYSLVGAICKCAVERKTQADAWGCVGGGRVRFTNCLRRLAAIKAPAIVVESSLDAFSEPPPYTRLTAAQAVGSFISWSCQYRIPIFFCPNRAYAERVTLRFLMSYWKHMVEHE